MVFFLKNTEKFSQSRNWTKMSGAEKEEFLHFFTEPYLYELELPDVKNNKYNKTLDGMSWI